MKNPPIAMFYWYYPTGGELWPEGRKRWRPAWNEIGVNMVWLPPAYKGARAVTR